MNYTEKNKLLDKISLIGLMLIFVELFLYFVDHCFTKRIDIVTHMNTIMIVSGLIFLAISVVLFVREKKYDKKYLKIYAIEFLALAILCPFISYWYYPKFFGLSTNFIHKIDHRVLWIAVLVYYVGRIIYASYKAYMNSNDRKIKKKKAKI